MRLKNITTDSEMEQLYDLMMNPKSQQLYANPVSINGIGAFKSWLNYKQDFVYREFKIVYDEKTHCILGFVYGYEWDTRGKHIYICVVMNEPAQNVGLGALAALSYERFLFRKLDLKKIYISVFEYNKRSLHNNLQAGFTEEAVLKENKFYNGKFYDVHILAIEHQTFSERYEKMMKDMWLEVEM